MIRSSWSSTHVASASKCFLFVFFDFIEKLLANDGLPYTLTCPQHLCAFFVSIFIPS
jgi:hypothetical protein